MILIASNHGGGFGGAGAVPWSPLDLPNLYRWGEAAQYNAGAVYPDLSGGGKDMARVGSVSILSDGGGRDYIAIPASIANRFELIDNTTFGPSTLSFCAEIVSTSSNASALFSVDTATDFQLDAGIAGQFKFRVLSTGLGASTFDTGVNHLGGPHVYTVIFDSVGGVIRLRVDGVWLASTSYTAGTFSVDNLRIASNRGVNADIEVNHYGEIFNGSIDPGEIAEIETYLGALAGLAI